MKRILIYLIVLIVGGSYAWLNLNLFQSVPKYIEPKTIVSNSLQEAYCYRVVDGDTIVVQMDGVEYKVRYIGIDTPETVDPRRPVGYFGKEASAKNKELVLNKTVWLEKDISETDKYGRLLRYVYTVIGIDNTTPSMVNQELVLQGYAKASTYPPDVKYASLFVKAEQEARDNKIGLWAE